MTMDRRRPSFCTPTARPHFFKIILDETSRETKLRLPYKFIKNYGAELSNSAYLKVQGGSRWEVEVTRSDRKVWFEKGWPNFADFYSIDYGYFLVFGYEGNSKFVVCIFDKTAMEIDYPISEDEDDDGDSSDEILEDFPKGSMTSEEESPLPNSDSHKKYRKGSTRKTEINPSIHILDDDNEDDESHDSSDEDSSSEGNEEEEEEEEEDTYGSEDMCSSSSEDEDPDYVEDGLKVKLHNRNNKTVGTKESNIRHVGELSRNQKFSKQRVLKVPGRMEEIAFQRAKDFKSIDPHFVVQIGRSTTRGCYLHVPSVFAETYLRKQPCYIILRAVSNEKTWSVVADFSKLRPLRPCSLTRMEQFIIGLKIPREFLQHFHGDIPNKCHLETAAQSWLVEAEKVNNKFFFQKGWNKFVVDNDLKYGEFLVFNYAGNSNFHVDIFGINGCLKLTELPDEMEEVDEDDDVSLEVLDDSPLSTPLPQTRIKTSGRGKAEINSNLRERGPNPEKTEMKKREAHWSNCELKWKADFPANKDRAGTSSTLVSGVKKHEHVEALQRAKAFKDENPSSVLVSMTHSYIKYWFVRLPSEFTRLVRPSIGDSGNVLLRVSAGRVRTWPARVTCESSGSNRTKIHCGWTNFVQANKLKQGDVCAFVLIKDIKVVIEVVIFRNKDAENCRFSPDISDNHYEEDVDFEDDAEDEDEDDEEEEEEDDNFLPRSRTLGVASSFHKRKINRTSSSAKGHSRNMKQAGRLFKDYMILKAIAKEEADAFKETCDHPSFVVSLPASCARGSKWNNGFDFPRSFAIQYLTKQQPRRVTLWIKKRFWLVKVNYYGKTARLQGGWGQFVKDNNLTTGDACVFVLTNPSIFDFDVENFRLSK